MSKSERCKCVWHTYMVGDGCRYCNPQLHIDLLTEEVEDQEKEIERLRSLLRTAMNSGHVNDYGDFVIELLDADYDTINKELES